MNSQRDCGCSFWAYAIAAIGTFLIVAGLVWVMVSYNRPAPLGEDRAALRRKNLAELRAANAEALNNPNFSWQDQTKGIVHLPIDRAMDLSLQLWQNPQAARSNLIARVEKANFKPPEKPSQFE